MSQQMIHSKSDRLKKWLVRGAAGAALIFVGAQFVPVYAEGMQNPKEQPAMPEKAEVVAILKRACYDCHSNEVRYPWYAKVAPVSWLVARDVVEGRKGINFSEWPEDNDDRQFNREAVWDSVKDGEMPLWFYPPMHPEANLSDADKAILKAWSEASADEEEEGEEDEKGDKADKEEKEEKEEGDSDQAEAAGSAKPSSSVGAAAADKGDKAKKDEDEDEE